MIDFVCWVFVGVCWILGFNFAFQDGEILGKLGQYLQKYPMWFKKMTFDCPFCMSSVHGSTLFWLFVDYPWYFWPIYVVSLTGLVVIVKK